MKKSDSHLFLLKNVNSFLKTSLLPFLIICVVVFASAILTSCGLGKTKTPPPEIVTPQGTKVYNPKTGRYEFPTEVTGKMDTVQWTDAGSSANDPIGSDSSQYLEIEPEDPNPNPSNGTGILSTYNIAIMIPFNSDKVNSLEGGIHSSSIPALHFYEGAKIALDELSNEGANLNVTVMDTKRSETETSSILNRSTLQDAHLIIGPYSSKPLEQVAEFAKVNQKTVISPVNTSGKITAENPFYLQANPSLQSHCEVIMKHALSQYSADQIVLVVRDKEAEVNRLKYFQDTHQLISGTDAPPLKEYRIDPVVAQEFGELNLSPYIKKGQTTVFIVPSYSNETFVSNLMRQVEIAKGRNEVVMYGMPRWMEYERISFDYFENLKLHVSTANFVDKEDVKVKEFIKKFFERYGSLPQEDAFQGYDLTLYSGRQLMKHGMYFKDVIDTEAAQMLSTKFEFERFVTPEDAANERFDKINYIENKYVNILKFEDYHFQKVN
ncbi:MAG: ABC transporter substrate-binding protein [Saprospiraceae bacterium]